MRPDTTAAPAIEPARACSHCSSVVPADAWSRCRRCEGPAHKYFLFDRITIECAQMCGSAPLAVRWGARMGRLIPLACLAEAPDDIPQLWQGDLVQVDADSGVAFTISVGAFSELEELLEEGLLEETHDAA